MKNLFVFFSISVLVAACNEQIKNNPSDNQQAIIMDTSGNATIEKNLKLQLEEYLVAVNTGDADKALYYIYPDMFEYLKLQFPEEEIDMQTLKDSVFIEPMKRIKKLSKEKNFQIEFEIGDITKRVQYKDYKLFMVTTRLNSKRGLDSHSFGEETIGISNDGGKTWKFIANDPETLTGIMKLRFPKSVIDELSSK